MLNEVVTRTVVPMVVYSLFVYRLQPVMWVGRMALHCRSNQYIAHYAYRSGGSNISLPCGIFTVNLKYNSFVTSWTYNAVLSFKPVS